MNAVKGIYSCLCHLCHLLLFADFDDFFTFETKRAPKKGVIHPGKLSESRTNLQSCFENDVIRSRILDFALVHDPQWNEGAKELLALRIISKSMNVAILSEFRHRSLTNKIVFNNSSRHNAPWDFELLAEEEQLKHYKINVNQYRIKLSELPSLFRFFNYHRIHPMNDGAELHVSNLCTRYTHLNRFIHREIIGTLYGSKKSYLTKIVGMKLLCEGCATCLDFCDGCDDHDFVTMKKLEYGFPDGKVFKNVEVSIKVQNEIIERFIGTTPGAVNMKAMAEFIRSNFYCEKHYFWD
ncbi:hypothetical protein B9Z55_022809 [Caenorhabditis nigoni]|uniref:DUF38 domain-containing protein n=2 Tax=Caenorhabditis nigoni TaxID=1611254 RepID=A0A2G5SLT2_9PELO|nr:hypothetical protein B9Z55_022809 [Caenorhabditis nigoni]